MNQAGSSPDAGDFGDVPFYVMPSRLDLIKEVDGLIRAIETQLGETPPAVFVLDTLNRSLVGSEANDETMGAYIKAADAIRDRFNCAVIIVHHCGHEKSRPRGHTSLTGAADAQIHVVRDDSNDIVATVEFMKDGPEDEREVSRLKVVELGTDDDGNLITSCVVVPVDAERSDNDRSQKRNGAAQIALLALRKAIEDSAVPTPQDDKVIPPGAKVASIENWRRYAYQLGISGSTQDRARQAAFKRGHDALLLSGTVKVWGGLAWIPNDLG